MTKTTEFLNPRVKLLDAVVAWLFGDAAHPGRVAETPEGVKSFAHVMVVVPTAQSGRNLRLALAREAASRGWGGVLPPHVVQPMHLIAAADESLRTASDVEARAAFLGFLEDRPRRRTDGGRVSLTEWEHLFRPEHVTDVRSLVAFFDQLGDIWRILAGGGLLMRDVPADPRARDVLAAALGDEAARWNELAAFESAFFEFLHRRGLRHQAEEVRAAKTDAKPFPEEVREVVLPALADPVSVLYDVLAQQSDALNVSVLVHAAASDAGKFDAWGRPLVSAWTGANRPRIAGLSDADVVRAANDAGLARRVAADFPPAASDRARPSFGLCDADAFPELAAAFLNAGYELHNPERHRIASSSLGRMLGDLLDLFAARHGELPWKAFTALLREDDVLSRLTGGGDRPCRRDVLAGVDACRNAFLPVVLPADCGFDATRLKSWDRPAHDAFRDAARALKAALDEAWSGDAAPAAFLRRTLEWVYARRTLRGASVEKEFQAAAAAVGDALSALESPAVVALGLREGALLALARKTFSEAAYALEPDSRQALKTEGWLELVWSGAGKMALVGFHEGAVPDSVVGHPFVPDALRAALGLTTNDRRLARDTYLLSDIVAARASEPGSVRAYIALTNNAGDIRRPSRLLFLTAPEALPDRVRALFGDAPAADAKSALSLEDAWRPRLPLDPVPLPNVKDETPDGRLSASAIDTWLKCPFTYLLKTGLGLERLKLKDELGPEDFGNLVHKALERYAEEQLARTARGQAQLCDAAEIAAAFARVMAELRAAYGERPPVKIRLQLDAAASRLAAFAALQATWAQDGWTIAEKPEFGFTVRPFAGEDGCDVPIKGSVDRIDFKAGVGYRLIDYKTWDRRSGAAGRILKGGAAQVAHAKALRLPLGSFAGANPERRFLSVQLPLYARCLETLDAGKFRGKIADLCYAILGENAENIVVLGSAFDHPGFEAVKAGKVALADHKDLAIETARTAIRRMRGNFFWPPGPGREWKYDYAGLLLKSPERDFPKGSAWRDAQEARLAGLEARV